MNYEEYLRNLPTIDIDYLEKSSKSGDNLFQYHHQWWALFSKVIAFFTKAKLDHATMIYCNKVFNNELYDKLINEMKTTGFKISELHFVDNKIIIKSSITNRNKITVLDPRKMDIYYACLIKPLTNAGEIKGWNDCLKLMEKYGKQSIWQGILTYNWKQLPLTLNWVFKVLPKETQKKLLQKSIRAKNQCSTASLKNGIVNGSVSKAQYTKDAFVSPIERMTMDCFKVYRVIAS